MNEIETTPTAAEATETAATSETPPASEEAKPEAQAPASQPEGEAKDAGQATEKAKAKTDSLTLEERAAQEQLAADLTALYDTHIKRGGSAASFGAGGASWAAMISIAGGLTLKQHQRAATSAYLLAIRHDKSIGAAEAMRLLIG